MAQEVGTFNGNATTVTWSGHTFMSLGSGDDSIAIALNTDGITNTVGSKGDVTYSLSTDNTGTVTIRVLGTSSSNTFLYNIANSQKIGAIHSSPMIIENTVSGYKFTGNKCILSRAPDTTLGATSGEKEWVFSFSDYTEQQGDVSTL